jgi:catechol 2,3-dioxygenase-like lactoylglutathione lyase family enzyme
MAQRPTYVLDHVGLPVRDLAASRRFYEAALEPLGFSVVMDFGNVLGIGLERMPQFWVHKGEPGAPVHVAFHAEDRSAVDVFHAAALAAGGRDNGPPGLRPQYHPSYYAAYAFDPDRTNALVIPEARLFDGSVSLRLTRL